MTALPPRSPGSLRRAMLVALGIAVLEASLLALALGGPRGLVEHRRALVLVAVWTAGGLVLAWRRAPGRAPAAERVPGQAALLAALVVLPLVTPMLCAWAERAGWWPLPGGAAVRWAGVTLAALGLALRVASMLHLGSRFMPVVALESGHALETGGPYARLRHPGYAGAWLANLGAVLAFGSAAGLLSVALFSAALEARVRGEEAFLARRFGAAWTDYSARVGRWGPRLR